MPADKRSDNEPSRRGNSEYQWAAFDSEAYFNHYYGESHPDDDRVIECAVEALKQARPGGELDLVDVGTGPNPIPLFCALPRARSLTVWEYAESNVAWLKAELAKDAMRPQWQHFWGVTRRAYGADHALPENPMRRCAPRRASGRGRSSISPSADGMPPPCSSVRNRSRSERTSSSGPAPPMPVR